MLTSWRSWIGKSNRDREIQQAIWRYIVIYIEQFSYDNSSIVRGSRGDIGKNIDIQKVVYGNVAGNCRYYKERQEVAVRLVLSQLFPSGALFALSYHRIRGGLKWN